MRHASELPNVELLTDADLARFSERRFYPTHREQSPNRFTA